jgi:FkbM family methyltransferase
MTKPWSRVASAAVGHLPYGVKHRLAQALTDRRLVGRRWNRVRRALVARGGDPSVEFDLDGTALQLPLSHRLPDYRRDFALFSANLGEVARLVADLGGRTMIDVGANVGDSVAIVKARAPEMAILCVEADPEYVPFLRTNTARWADVEIAAPVLLAERTGARAGALNRSHGTTRFVASQADSYATTSLDDLLRQRSRYSTPALLKSDTDGFEGYVLSGASSLLATVRPVLFLEYHPALLRAAGSDGLEILAGLRTFGYDRIAFYDKFGVLLVRCRLADEALLGDLHAYAATNPERRVDHFDVVVVTPEYHPVVDGLRGETPRP